MAIYSFCEKVAHQSTRAAEPLRGAKTLRSAKCAARRLRLFRDTVLAVFENGRLAATWDPVLGWEDAPFDDSDAPDAPVRWTTI